MTDPFLGHLKTQLTAGRQRLRRRRRTIGVLVAVLVLAATTAGLVGIFGRESSSIKVATDGGNTEPTSGGSVVSTTVTTLPPTSPLDSWQTSQAERTVRSFIASLTNGADAEAAALLSDYAVVTGDAGTAVDAVERFRTENEWLLSPTALQMTVTPSFSYGDPNPVVTVVARTTAGAVEHAIAIVIARDDDDDASTLPAIIRLPQLGPDSTPPSGSTVSPGEIVSLPGLPVEGGATAYVNGAEVAADVDYETQKVKVTVPEVPSGDIVLTISLATPEEPTARAVWFRIGAE